MTRLPPLLALLSCTAAFAAPDCSQSAVTQTDLTDCAREIYIVADAELNRAYDALHAELTASEQEALRNVQRAWLQFRDLECTFVASKFAGGSAEPMEHYGCLAQLSKQRSAQLHEEQQSRNPGSAE